MASPPRQGRRMGGPTGMIVGVGQSEATGGSNTKAGVERDHATGWWHVFPAREKGIEFRLFPTYDEAQRDLERQRREMASQRLEPNEQAVLKELRTSPTHYGDIGREAKLSVAETTAALTGLELKGYAKQVQSSHYVRTDKGVKAPSIRPVKMQEGRRNVMGYQVGKVRFRDKTVAQKYANAIKRGAGFPELNEIILADKSPTARMKATKGISREAAVNRLYSETVATGRSKKRDATADIKVTSQRIAPSTAKTEADLKLQQEWFRHPNRLDFEGVDTGAKPPRKRSPIRSRGLR